MYGYTSASAGYGVVGFNIGSDTFGELGTGSYGVYPSTGFVLLQNSGLTNPAGWSTYGGKVSTNNGVNSITITPPTGNLFFRLKNP